MRYSYTANGTPDPRVGEIQAAGRIFTLTQLALVPTDFAVSVTDPEIGEEVVFTVDAALVPVSWDFGSPDCGWNGPTIDCTSNPAACRNISWYFPQAGLFDVTLTTTTGTRTRELWVRNVGSCPDICYATGAPDPAFTMTPNPVQAGTEVSFFHSEDPVVEVCEFVIDPESASYPAAFERVESARPDIDDQIKKCINLIRNAKRPVIILGWGIRISGAEAGAKAFVENLGFPFTPTWAMLDFLPYKHPLFVGTFGSHGTRYGNFTVQNADLIISIGARLDTREAGSPITSFSREAKKIIIDIDKSELEKFETLGLKAKF